MGYLLIGILVILAFVKVVLNDKKKNIHIKKQPHVDNTEEYIPQSVMNSALKCSKCGASIPLSKDKKLITMFCPFCGNPIEDAKKVIEQATQNRIEERNYEVRIRELENQVREQENEKRRIRHKTLSNAFEIVLTIAVFYFLYKLIFSH